MSQPTVADTLHAVGVRLQHRHGSEPIPTDELVRETVAACGCSAGGVHPTGHCYDRVSDGMTTDDPMFLHAGGDGSGRYWFVGRGHDYTGPRTHYPPGGAPRVVGEWVHGEYRPLTDQDDGGSS